MQIIKLSATESTNTYLKELAFAKKLPDFTVVTTQKQTKGRGQMNAVWESYEGKNLTFSVLKKFNKLAVEDQFLISICVSLAVSKSLKALGIPNIKIKWPNDILSGNSKICGILIENSLTGLQISSSVIGIGLNVNQIIFENQPKASSILLLTGNKMDLDTLLAIILKNIKHYLSSVNTSSWDRFLKDYYTLMFKKDVPVSFGAEDGSVFMGTIVGVARTGKLKIILENGVLKEFNLKEVKMHY